MHDFEKIDGQQKITLAEYNELQKHEMQEPKYIQRLIKKLGRPPTRNEIAKDFVLSGRSDEFEKKYQKFLVSSSEKKAEVKKGRMRIICSSCGKDMGQKECPLEDIGQITHSICDVCKAKLLREHHEKKSKRVA